MANTHQLRTGGLAIAGTGSCLMWTIVLIPLAIPMLLVGVGMFVWSFFTKRENVLCPACHESAQIDAGINVIVCPHCQKSITRTEPGSAVWTLV